ncbi:putative serine/threonine-protein kinase nek2 [Cucumis melo var. makuwa]|uniref:Putative serine/threonine-protein kinase nek2 n=1 Tax=Cucumis melo var. makuwa TaxID=1194695 RepID=A0A5D3CXE6_CUCMM|nr:putative serine/threonine-protein kinase nek2 [Cucumis melo var. makuwa]
MTMNLEISCYIVKEYLVICQISMQVTIWMRICQHMYDQTVKAHGFLNNTLIFSLHMEPTIVRDDQDKEVGGAEIDGLVVEVVDEHVEKPKQQRNRSRKSILKTAGTAFRQFKHWLTKKYILPFKNEPELLKRPPYKYSYIDQKQWEEFVRSRYVHILRTKENFNKRDERRISITIDFQEKKNIPSKESELDRASMWKKARVDKKGQYDNEDVQEVVNRIDEISKTCADKEPSPNDVLTQALGTRESSGRARGVGGGHWALLAINAYDEIVYYLDSLRTTSRVDIRYVTDTTITIFRS